MACINTDGTLTRSGELILLALKNPCTPEEAAKETGLPLFKVRSAVRELLGLQLVEKVGEEYRTTDVGLAKMEGSS